MEGLNIPRQAHPKSIIIKNTTKRRIPLSEKAVEKYAFDVLKLLGKEGGGGFIGINFFSDKRMKVLNRQYFKVSSPTDVIAFSYSGNTADIAISLDTAKRNAGAYNSPLKKEILLYIIHGILHLNGYDDTTPMKKTRMFKKQEEILKKIWL